MAGDMTPEKIKFLVDNLSKLEPGNLPFDVFHAVTRLVATPIIELVPLRRDDAGKTEVLLLRRDTNDPVWPNQLHVPGTVVRASDTEHSFEDAFMRITRELGGINLDDRTFVGNIIHHSGRGMEVSQVFWADLSNAEVSNSQFYPVENLPQDIVTSQLDFIPDAIAHFEKSS